MSFAARTNQPGVSLPGYIIDALIFDGDPTRIYRAKRESDGLPVMLKSVEDEQLAREVGACLRHEFEIAKRFQVPSVIRVYGLEHYRNIPVIVMEDFGGDSLNNLAKQHRFSLEEILEIAISITKGLGEIHAQNIIHKDITPANLVYNPESRVLKIIDFGISSYLTREQAAIASPRVVEANLPYLSPEQTGRMNRSIDYRTDYYSLGATLYELLTGQKLFDVEEPIEWFHCHIARQPIPVDQLNISVPKAVSNIVMKLLEKMAEDRYQSARGIESDLQFCLDQLRERRVIDDFQLGRNDRASRFQIPQRLYGREKEIDTLLNCFDRVSKGNNELILVSGYSGIGKTCLIKEIYKPITERRGHFISGKFDQLHRNVPYSALAIALKDLVNQLLTETDDQLRVWKQKILKVLGGNGRLITNIINELELIIGPQPEVPELSPIEAEQRFHLMFHNFIQVFAELNHPLVIFLDDLQWADSASLRILALLSDPEASASYLMIVGSYRDNEVQAGHPLRMTLSDLIESGAKIDEIMLKPLNKNHLAQLISDTLNTSIDQVELLADLVQEKTAGNPFFTEEFLKYLHKEGYIQFDYDLHQWQWDLDKIKNQKITDNVVELMTDKLNLLPNECLTLLKIAACIGNRFRLRVLSVVSSVAQDEVARALKAAMTEGVIAPLGDAYQLVELDKNSDLDVTVEFAFAHDRIQQAAYLLLTDGDRSKTHLNIGRLLQNWLTQEQLAEQIFEVVNHLNLGKELIDQEEERVKLCRLNMEAGKRAKASTAYQAAFSYFSSALDMVPQDCWQSDYILMMDLHVEAAEAAALNHDYSAMDNLLSVGFDGSQNLLDEARLRLVQVMALKTQGKLKEALKIGKAILAKLKHVYPKRTQKYHVVIKLFQLAIKLKKFRVEDILNMPVMTDSHHKIANAIGAQLGRAAMFVEPQLLPTMALNSLLIQLKYGHAPGAVASWGVYGMILAVELNKPEKGLAFGKLSIDLVEKYQIKENAARAIHVYNAMIRHWKEPLATTLEPLNDAYRLGMETGDFEYATLAISVRQFNAYYSGQHLGEWFQDTQEYQEAIRPMKQGMTSDYLDLCLQFYDCLVGEADDPSRLIGKYYDVEVKREQHEKAGDVSFMVLNSETEVLLKYLFGDFVGALRLVEGMRTDAGGFGGFYRGATSCMMESLVILRNLADLDGVKRKPLMRKVRRNQKKMKKWMSHCPENYQNKFLLVEAEKLRCEGKEFEAHDLFEQSMALAKQQGFIQEQAMAAEQCAIMHFNSGRKTMAEPYLSLAHGLYESWGAKAKLKQLEKQYPQLVKSVVRSGGTTTSALVSFDITALTKALKAIADEKIHSRMIKAIIETAVEFAGAQQGVLILRNADAQLCIEGEYSIEKGVSKILQSIPIEEGALPQTLINYVIRTHASVVVHDAQHAFKDIAGLESDPYIRTNQVRSILCLPIISGSSEHDELIGLIYLENNLASGSFTQERFGTLEIIGMAAAGRLELSRKAAFDGLTGLFNHEYFQNMLSQELSAAQRYRRDLGLVLIDIDHFKQFNDTWGHQLGDLVLKEVAQLIKTTCRTSDIVARYGGEEMVVIFPSTSEEDAKVVSERIREAVENHLVEHEGEKLTVTISLGLAMLKSDSEEKDELIRRADEALYQSKEGGRNRLTLS